MATPIRRLAIIADDGRVHVFDADTTVTAARQFFRGWKRYGAKGKLRRVDITPVPLRYPKD